MYEKACCIIGLADITPQKVDFVKTRLEEEIESAIANGFKSFITGMDKEAELIFAQLVIEKKQKYPNLFLEAALAYRGRVKTDNAVFQKCLVQCDGISVHQEIYTDDCLTKLNQYMLALCERVILVCEADKISKFAFTNQNNIIIREIKKIQI